MSGETTKSRAAIILLLAMTAPVCLGQRGSRNLSNPDPYSLQQKLNESLGPVEPATSPITVAELEKLLAENQNKRDKKLASILTRYSLTERLSSARLSRWISENPGARTQQALTVLSDGSAFKPLPAEDEPAAPRPSVDEQRKMMDQMGEYLKYSLPRIPNLVATRHTVYFEDRPPRGNFGSGANASKINWPVHLVGTSDAQVSYVNGREVIRKNGNFTGFDSFGDRLSTTGEFGAILYGVILDASGSNLAWNRWEQGENGLLAVYRFDASREKSHFALRSHDPHKTDDLALPYRGEITVNPADGSIVRLVLSSVPSPADNLAEADIAVEYGPVEIGQQLYTCPIHGVAVSKIPLHRPFGTVQNQSAELQTEINDVVFQQYHVFRGDSRILEDAEARP